MIFEYLTDTGFVSADYAQTLEEATYLAAQRVPDLITADDRLLRGSGVDAVRQVCRGRAFPVVFVVADPTHVKRAIPDAIVLLKPFSGDSLTIAVRLAENVPLSFE